MFMAKWGGLTLPSNLKLPLSRSSHMPDADECLQLVEAFFPSFDADTVITRMMSRSGWPSENYIDPKTGKGYLREEIKALWDAKGMKAQQCGSWMHHHIERALNGLPPDPARAAWLALKECALPDVVSK